MPQTSPSKQTGWLKRTVGVLGRLYRRVRPGRRIKTPTVLQMEAVECGATALGIILSYYGRIVPLEELRDACGVSRDGSNAGNMVKAARTYGLKAKGFSKRISDLQQLPLPVIVFWNFDHFVVVEGFDEDRVYLNDPARGPRVVTAEEFSQSYTGVVLVFEPGPTFQIGGKKPSLIGSLSRRLVGSGTGLAFVLIASLALVIPGLVIPIFSRLFVDRILVARNEALIIPLLLGMSLTAAMRAGLTWLQQRYLLRLETKLALSNASQFVAHVLSLPARFFTQRYAGDVSYRIQINERVAQLLSGELATTLLDLVLIVFFAILMALIDPLLTSLGIAVAVLNLLALRAISRRRIDVNRRLQQERGKLLATSMGGLQRIETLKATGSESDYFARWAGYQAKVINAQQQLGSDSNLLMAVPGLLLALNNVAVLSLGALRVMDGVLTVGMLIAFQSLMSSFISPINRLVGMGSRLQIAEADMARLDDVLNYAADPQAGLVEGQLGTGAGQIKLSGLVELRNVSFGYSRLAPPLIKDFNLTLKPGERVALVGESGSGKSTIARLISGLYEPWEGEILFDGQPRQALPRGLVNSSLTMVDQDIALFSGTVRENITLWDATMPEKNILQAAKDAGIHQDILDRPDAYEAPVEEGGRNFSGGQRQRMEIARALVDNPTIVVFDEATSALDAVTEQTIDTNLRQRGCTTLIVAHRLSTIRDCDEIIVLEQGRVVQRGTHDEMIREDGTYARLISTD